MSRLFALIKNISLCSLLFVSSLSAQTAKDSLRAKEVRAWTDSVRKILAKIDSIEDASLIVPNKPPVAQFVVSCVPGACSFDASTSTDDKKVVSFSWSADTSIFLPAVGPTLTRQNLTTQDVVYNETLVVADSEGVTNTITKLVTIPFVPLPPTIAFSANPASVVLGKSSVLSWNASNAVSCIASNGWTGIKQIQSTEVVTPISNTVYTLTCNGLGGTVVQNVTVGVTIPVIKEVAELPRDTVAFLPHKTWPCDYRATSPAQLNSLLLSTVKHNDVVCIPVGSVWSVSQALPRRLDNDSSIVTIRIDLPDSLFALPNQRITPTIAATVGFPVIRATNRVFYTNPGAHGYHIIGLDLQTTGMVNGVSNSVVELGQNPSNILDFPRNIYLDRVLLRPSTPLGLLRRGVITNGASLAVVNSWCEDVHETGFDSQCVIGWAGTGPYRITNNFMNASGEIFMMGGSDPVITNLRACDVTVARNHIYRSKTWIGVAAYSPIKSTIETKSICRVDFNSNVIDGGWMNGHLGESFTIKSADQYGKCHECFSSDVTIRNNYIKNHGSGIYIVGADNTGSSLSRTDSVTRRVLIVNNWIDSIGVAPFTGNYKPMRFIAGNLDVEVRNNVWANGVNIDSYLSFDKNGPTNNNAVVNLLWKNNIVQASRYGATGCLTNPPWIYCASNVTFGTTGIVGKTSGILLVPGAITYPTLSSALLSGLGVQWSSIQSAIAGVVVPR